MNENDPNVQNQNEEDSDEDEPEELENRRAAMFDRGIRGLYGRGRTSPQLDILIQDTVRYFHPDRRYDECLPSMMQRRREFVALTDQYPARHIIMDTDEDDNFITRIRCLRHCERPSLNTYDIWIRMHRRNEITGIVECAVMRGPVVTGVQTSRQIPFSIPLWGSNGRYTGRERIHWNAHTRVVGGVQSLGGRYITTITHNLRNPAEGPHTQIGIYTLTQVREFFPIIGVMYAMHYQLLESHEAADWLWIRSYIEPIQDEYSQHTFQLRRPSL
jgi:hypothetical protein